MPVYAYRCENCDVQFERLQKFSDDPIRRCPECEEETVRRVIQPAGIIFKGSGWYVTDSRSSNSAAPGKNSDSSESKSETKSESSSDSSKSGKSSKSSKSKDSTSSSDSSSSSSSSDT